MNNRLWPTDRVRACVKELCRQRCSIYNSVSQEEGLALLAAAASCSLSELEIMNPIHYVRQYLDDTQGDPIEMIIKLCHLFGPYTYKGLATLYAQEYRLPSIPESSEPPSSSESLADSLDVPQYTEDCTEDLSDSSVEPVSDSSVVTLSDSSVEPVSDSSVDTVNDSPIKPMNESPPENNVEEPRPPPPPPKGCGCFLFRW